MEILDCVDEALTTIAALAGLFDENFYRGAGWIFYELGRQKKNASIPAERRSSSPYQEATEHDLDVLLDFLIKICRSPIARARDRRRARPGV